ncbi:MAG: AAA family ATPase [Tepidisphaeraceae bacterium]|jgi:predicted ATPase
MLTRIHIQKFRLCQDVLIDNAGSIVALVGHNGTGKSNILQAIYQTARMATAPEPSPSENTTFARGSTIELDFKIPSNTYRYLRTLAPVPGIPKAIVEKLSLLKGDTFVDILVRERGQVTTPDGRTVPIGEIAPCLPAISALLPANDPLVLAISPARSFLSTVRYYPVDEPVAAGDEDRLIPQGEYAAWVAEWKSTGIARDSVLMRILDMLLDKEKADNLAVLQQLLGQNGLGLIDGIHPLNIPVPTKQPPTASSSGETAYYRVLFLPSRGAGAFPRMYLPYDALSLGTRRVIRIFASMLFDGSSVMLLEQPEDSLHQGLTKKVIGLLRQNAQPAQLIMSSHSSALLNKLAPDEIRLVSLHEGFTSIRKLSPDELSLAVDFMNKEGPLYDFLETVQEE